MNRIAQQIFLRLPRSAAWRFALALLFVAGQACALMHATHHELSAPDTAGGCEICDAAHGNGAAVSLPDLSSGLRALAEPPLPRAPSTLALTRAARPGSRAPPRSLV